MTVSLATTRRGGQRWTIDQPPPKIRAFIEWYCFDRGYGETYRNFARAMGYSENTIQTWLRDPRVITLLERTLAGTNAGPVKVQEVLDMLHRRATQEDDVKAARTYLEAVGKMMPRRSEVEVTINDARSLSDQQLAAELKRAVDLLEGRALPEAIEEAEVIEDTLDEVGLDA